MPFFVVYGNPDAGSSTHKRAGSVFPTIDIVCRKVKIMGCSGLLRTSSTIKAPQIVKVGGNTGKLICQISCGICSASMLTFPAIFKSAVTYDSTVDIMCGSGSLKPIPVRASLATGTNEKFPLK